MKEEEEEVMILNSYFREKRKSIIEYIIVLAVVAGIMAALFPGMRGKLQTRFAELQGIQTEQSASSSAQKPAQPAESSDKMAPVTWEPIPASPAPPSEPFDFEKFAKGVLLVTGCLFFLGAAGASAYGWSLSMKQNESLGDIRKRIARLILRADELSFEEALQSEAALVSSDMFEFQQALESASPNPVSAFYLSSRISRFEKELGELEKRLRRLEGFRAKTLSKKNAR